jgi:hypothetical protein
MYNCSSPASGGTGSLLKGVVVNKSSRVVYVLFKQHRNCDMHSELQHDNTTQGPLWALWQLHLPLSFQRWHTHAKPPYTLPHSL